MRNHQQQLAVLPEPHQLIPIVTRSASQFVRRYKWISGAYFLGLFILMYVARFGGVPLNRQQHQEYTTIMNSIDLQAEYDASMNVWQARQAYQATRGWFFGCDSTCQRNKERLKRAQDQLDRIRAEGYARMSDAKATAGLLSEVGVAEVTDSFWQYFSNAKQFAKRQSMWDVLFMGIRNMHRARDESWMEFAIKVLLQVLLNFSVGLVMALIFFSIGLWTIVTSYQPNPVVAVLFFVGAVCAAFSFVASYLLAVYGAAATGVYGVLKLAETSARAQLQDQQRRQRVEYNGRPHYD